MKERLIFAAMLLLGELMAACSSDSPEEEDIILGTIIEEVKCDDKMTDFLNEKIYTESLYPIAGAIRYPFFNEYTGEKRNIIIIDSQKEFLGVFPDAGGLPEIDFSKYTLIIGSKQFRWGIGDKIPQEQRQKQLYKNNNEYTLVLRYTYYISEIGLDSTHYLLTWGLYPKLSSDSINIIIKYV